MFRTAGEQKKSVKADVVAWHLLELPVRFAEPWGQSIHQDVDNHETPKGWAIEKSCFCQWLKGCYNKRFDLNRERFGKDKWVTFNYLKNGVSNIREVQGDLAGNSGDKWVGSTARWVVH